MTFSFFSPALTTTDMLNHKHQQQDGMIDSSPSLEKWMMYDSTTGILDRELASSLAKQDYDATPASESPTSQYNDVLNDPSPFNTPSRQHYTLDLDNNVMPKCYRPLKKRGWGSEICSSCMLTIYFVILIIYSIPNIGYDASNKLVNTK